MYAEADEMSSKRSFQMMRCLCIISDETEMAKEKEYLRQHYYYYCYFY